MTVPNKYRLSFPVYRPKNEDDHYLNNRFVERIFNELPITKIDSARKSSSQYGMAAGDEVTGLQVVVPAVINQQFVISVNGLAGNSSSSSTSTPGVVGGRVIVSLMASYNGTDVVVQRFADWIVPTTAASGTYSSVSTYWQSPINGNVRFFLKCTLLTGTGAYGYVAADSSANTEITVQSFGTS